MLQTRQKVLPIVPKCPKMFNSELQTHRCPNVLAFLLYSYDNYNNVTINLMIKMEKVFEGIMTGYR